MFLRNENLTYLLLVLLCVVGTQSLHAETEDPNSVVATVSDVNILYKDINADLKTVQMLHPEYSKLQIENEVQKQETRRLIGKIREVIFKQKITEFGLTVSEKEVDAKVEEIFRKTEMTPQKAKKVCEKARSMYEALAEWHKNPSQEDAIYNEKLAGLGVNKEEWKTNQACCYSPEKLKHLLVPKNIEDMKKNSRESSRRDVLYQKLEDVITKDISVSKKEIEEEYRKKQGAEEIEQMGLIEKELLTRKKDMAIRTWWQEQYNKSNIVMLDKRFDEALGLLNNR